MKSCGYCHSSVDLSMGPHIHDPKRCRGCKEIFPASNFPLHPSSADGHRHDCKNCVGKQKLNTQESRAIERDRQFRSDNDRVKKHGYRWKRRPEGTGADQQFVWDLLDSQGRVIVKEQALDYIQFVEASEAEDLR
ncbi:hypothetical protein SAMN04489740_4324 [Arthrobacter alpinus]|uniref:Uncharacterized protein n=2 Tax=Arthrobacter alpinus TaxID=656366 RepID=A0A1H5PIM6_9MICC|nr:hypothetical protein SAMN04489740_4324 [Arthrobacter alpinus]